MKSESYMIQHILFESETIHAEAVTVEIAHMKVGTPFAIHIGK